MNYRLKQNLRLFAPVLAFAFYFSGLQADEIHKLETLSDPFVVVDYDASIPYLPADKQDLAKDWRKQMLALEHQLESAENKDKLKVNITFNTLYQQLDQLFADNQTDLIKVNVLANLSNEEQLQALELWRDIQLKEIDLLSHNYSETEEQELYNKYAKLDAILSSID
jgi:formyltetrahydrofolate hydrolase